MPTRAAIYLRISLDRTGDEAAVDRQLEDCLAIIAQRGWTQAGEPYVDNSVSASKRNVARPEYDRMVADYQRGAFDAIVCYDLDRLTRQPRQLEDWIDAAEETGLILVTANGEADLSTDGGRMFARVKAAVARSEIERKGARHRRANEQRIAQGKPLPGRRRYGYERDGITPREDEAAIVRRIFSEVAGGATLRAVALGLLRDEVPHGTGKGWSTIRLRAMLQNPSYGGLLHAHGQTHDSSLITPIVDPALAEEVRAILADETRRTTPGPGRRHIGSGIVLCGVEGCGRPLAVHSGYYVCKITTGARTATALRDKSKHVGIYVPKLDRILREHMAEALLTSSPEELSGDEPEATAPLVAKLDRLEAATHSIVADRDEGLVSAEVARSRLIALRDERQAVEAALDASRAARTSSASLVTLAQELNPGGPAGKLSDFFAARDRVAEHLATLDVDRQRDALRQLLAVEVAPGSSHDKGRVKVWHLIASHLNPGAVAGEDAVADAV
ncbi:serine integrase [Microbacterium phage UtzChips]|nr:serine integrase [Microbacterium phage UtzChips]